MKQWTRPESGIRLAGAGPCPGQVAIKIIKQSRGTTGDSRLEFLRRYSRLRGSGREDRSWRRRGGSSVRENRGRTDRTEGKRGWRKRRMDGQTDTRQTVSDWSHRVNPITHRTARFIVRTGTWLRAADVPMVAATLYDGPWSWNNAIRRSALEGCRVALLTQLSKGLTTSLACSIATVAGGVFYAMNRATIRSNLRLLWNGS